MPKELMGVVQFRMAMAWQRVERAEDVHPRFVRDPVQSVEDGLHKSLPVR
jgi:hypothetical protein